jgi:hypothetical protein
MRMQRHYDEFDAEEASWLPRTLAWSAVILTMIVMLCTVLTLHASITSEQRTAVFQQSGIFP